MTSVNSQPSSPSPSTSATRAATGASARVTHPRGPRQQRAPTPGTDDKRQGILRAAEALFDEQGYDRTTIDQIAAALGVTKPYVYYYFRDKQQIFETLSWTPTVACFTVLDEPAEAGLPAHERVTRGLERLIRETITHHPAAFFPYREPQVFRPEYREEQRRLARHFYDQLCVLLEQGRASGHFEFDDPMITALAACSLPGFLYHWYRPDGRLGPDEVVRELSQLAWRVLGLRRPSPRSRTAAGAALPSTRRRSR